MHFINKMELTFPYEEYPVEYEGVELDIEMERIREEESTRDWAARQARKMRR